MKHRFSTTFVLSAILLAAACALAAEPEGKLPADKVKPGAAVLEWTADADATVSGFYIRMTKCMPPRDEPIAAALYINGKRIEGTAAVPKFGTPLRDFSLPYPFDPQVFPPCSQARTSAFPIPRSF